MFSCCISFIARYLERAEALTERERKRLLRERERERKCLLRERERVEGLAKRDRERAEALAESSQYSRT